MGYYRKYVSVPVNYTVAIVGIWALNSICDLCMMLTCPVYEGFSPVSKVR